MCVRLEPVEKTEIPFLRAGRCKPLVEKVGNKR